MNSTSNNKNDRQATQIWIESAECLVPRIGTQESRRHHQTAFRRSHPEIAAEIEAQPWYCAPDGPYGSDEFAVLNWAWIGADEVMKEWRSHVPVASLHLFNPQMLDGVRRHDALDNDDWIEYSFHLNASFALSVLKNAGMIPADSILMNEDERPLSYASDEPQSLAVALANYTDPNHTEYDPAFDEQIRTTAPHWFETV